MVCVPIKSLFGKRVLVSKKLRDVFLAGAIGNVGTNKGSPLKETTSQRWFRDSLSRSKGLLCQAVRCRLRVLAWTPKRVSVWPPKGDTLQKDRLTIFLLIRGLTYPACGGIPIQRGVEAAERPAKCLRGSQILKFAFQNMCLFSTVGSRGICF